MIIYMHAIKHVKIQVKTQVQTSVEAKCLCKWRPNRRFDHAFRLQHRTNTILNGSCIAWQRVQCYIITTIHLLPQQQFILIDQVKRQQTLAKILQSNIHIFWYHCCMYVINTGVWTVECCHKRLFALCWQWSRVVIVSLWWSVVTLRGVLLSTVFVRNTSTVICSG